MAIQPIDLQTIYSQMGNVAKNVAHQQNGNQLTQAMQENAAVQQKQEQLAQVHKTAENEAVASQIKDGAHQNNSFQNQRNQKKNQEEELEKNKLTEIRESFLGQNIDISR
ncbi:MULTISPECIES: hypothetical protein [unclassified Treponema]|uniref:hypothetical protein n=1 Tax=unclassified Treponema TaxID=2638727 RepID=UPI0025EB7A52|nr:MULTISPECIES: hypothetical protein [unclassified Treponema]